MAAVAAGEFNTLVLKTDGSLWAWGANWSGQLGDGTTTDRASPVQVLGFPYQVTATAAAGGDISPVSRTVGDGATASFTVTPAAGYVIGTATGCGGTLSGNTYTTGPITADCLVSATFTALPTYQITATAGTGGSISPATRTVFQGASTGFTVTRAAGYAIGTVSGCGGTLSGTTYTTGPITVDCTISATFTTSAMQRIAAGGAHSLAIEPDGSLWAWGANDSGQLGIGTPDQIAHQTPVKVLTGAAAVAASAGHSLALKTDGTLWAWGDNQYGQLGDGTTAEHDTPVRILTGVVAVATGWSHALALQTDGSLWTWGANDSGQLGIGASDPGSHPTPVKVLTEVAAIAAGYDYILALKTDGTLWAWGNNKDGQLGDGTTTNRASPVQVLGGVASIAAIAAGGDHTLALQTDGSLWSWGNNEYGQLGNGTRDANPHPSPVQILTGVAAIGAGAEHALAIKTDGRLWAWGYNNYGQLGDGTMAERHSPVPVLTDVAAVAAGLFHTLALKSDGSLWAWGWNAYGPLGDGTRTNRALPVPVAGFSYRVTATAGLGGAISPASRTLGYGATTTFTINPRPGYAIGTVSGCGGTLAGTTYTTGPITAACAVRATFSALPKYLLKIGKIGTGTVTSAPTGINCGTLCQASYSSGTSVVLTAKAGLGYQFAGWTDCPNPTGNTCTVSVTVASTVQARFVPTVRLTLTKTPAAYGTVTSSPAGITCGTACASASAAFAQGTTVTLTAQPRPGRSLKNWSGTGAGACTGTDLSCTVPMDAARGVGVVFQ